jgi:hypothetical protein
MGVVARKLILPPLPLSNDTLSNGQSQAFKPKKKAIFFNLNQLKLIDALQSLRQSQRQQFLEIQTI